MNKTDNYLDKHRNCDLLIFFPKDGYMSGVQRGKVSQRTLKTAVKIPSYLFEC